MESRQLRYFCEIAEAGSFTAAAARLHIAQPALSRQIAALEQELGTALFVRGPGGVTLTEAGEVLRRHADAVRLHMARAREEVASVIGDASGWMSFGTTQALGRLLFGPLAERMAERFPRLRLGFVEGVGANLLSDLLDGTLDVAITSKPAYAPGIAFRPLFSEPVFVVAAPEIALPARIDGWEDLEGLPLVVTNQQTSMASWVEEQSGYARAALDLRYRVESARAGLDIVRRGLACGVVPSSAIDEAEFRDELTTVRMSAVTLDRHLAWTRNREPTAAFRTLCDVVAEEVGRRYPPPEDRAR